MAEYFRNYVYEQWLEAADRAAFKASLDAMALSVLMDPSAHYYYRQSEYPAIEDYIDAWVKADDTALESYRQACLAVKAKYPKPE